MTVPPFRLQAATALAALCLVGCGGHSSNRSASVASPVTTAATTTQTTVTAPPLTQPLLLVSSDPADGATRVPTDQVLRLTFSEDLEVASVSSANLVVSSQGQPISTSFVASGATVSCVPSGAWPAGAQISVTAGSGLLAQSGAQATPASLSFETFAGPTAHETLALPGGARSAAALAELRDGRILTSGGSAGAALASAELYDPETGTLSATGSMLEARADHTATALRDGRLLVAGGAGATPLASLELFDPARGEWRALTAALATPRLQHQAFELPSGRVAFVGGMDAEPHRGGRPVTTIELFDPSSEEVSALAGPALPPSEWVQLPDGRLLNLTASLVLDLDTPGAPTPTANSISVQRSYIAIAPTSDGKILLAGGASGFGGAATPTLHAEVDVFDPATLTFTPGPALNTARFGARAVLLADGRTAVVGGAVAARGAPQGATSLELYSPSSGFEEVATPALDGVTLARLDRGGLLVTGARAGHADLSTSYDHALRFGPSALEVTPLPPHVVGFAAQGSLERCDPRSGLELTFSLPVEVASLTSAAITLQSASGAAVALEVLPSATGTRCHVRPLAPLASATSYELSVDGVRVSGATLAPTSHSFRTRRQSPLGSGGVLIVEKGLVETLMLAQDLNGDGDTEDPDELVEVFLGGAVANFQDPAQADDGAIYLPDSGNDTLWKLVDLNGDGDTQDAGESIAYFTGAALPLSSPGCVAIGPEGAVYLADNGTAGALDGIWRLVDLNGDGDVADAGEALLYNGFDYAGAMWGLQFDLRGDLYHTVTGPGGNMIVHHSDRDGDGNTHGAGERVVAGLSTDFITDLALAPRLGTWTGIGAGRTLTAVSGGATLFSDPVGVLGMAPSTTSFAGGRVVVSDLNGSIWELFDSNQDGDFDDADEISRLYGAGRLTRPYYVAAGQAPPRVRLFAAPQAGATQVEGSALPGAKVTLRLDQNGTLSETTVVADASGAFLVPLTQALQSGDQVSLSETALGGHSAPLTFTLR